MRVALRLVVLLAASILALEVASLAAGSMLHGWGFRARAREERAREERARADRSPPDARAREDLPVPPAIDYYALHPYLGFVADPASPGGPVRDANGDLETTDLGFFRRTRAVSSAARPLRVALFGGSVAFLFSFTVDDPLARLLSADDAAGREVSVESFAVPGYKQPQQLFALEYLLLLGERFDLVLNVDGFNEIALPPTENVPQGTAAIYPRSWAHLAGAVPAPAVLEAAARLSALRGARQAAARVLSMPGLEHSATGALAWQLIETLLVPRIVAAEGALARTARAGAGYATTGPTANPGSNDALLDQMVEVWRRSSLLMHQVCAANGIAYVHVLQPNQYVPGAKPLGDAERAIAYRSESPYRAAVESGYPRLVAAGARLRAAGVSFVDASGVFAGVEEQIYVDDCCHFNRRGSKLLAEQIAPTLREALR